jgi:pyridinium-3,5-bisthiocarboxylic acid mononucleotide nickel chelatase
MPGSGVVAWLDVTAGVAGDMLLGALVDAGADLAEVQRLVDRVLPETVRLDAAVVHRAGLRATKVDVHSLVEDHPHRRWAEIRVCIGDAGLLAAVAERATAVFRRLAEVEASAHGVPVEDVEFHEVGSWDSVADVVGTCAALHLLGVDEVVATRMALGSGTVRAAHGVLPVPVPAVLALVDGWSVEAGGQGELATPTGVALVTTYATAQGPLPPLDVVGSGTGAGTRDPAERPNVVRVVLGRRATAATGSRAMVVVEANVDDLDPRVWPTVLAALLEAGAADAWLTPILMKKGRPAHTLSVLADPRMAPALRDRVLELTSTIGVRQSMVDRWALERSWTDVTIAGGTVALKVAHRDGVVVHTTPEFDDVSALAAQLDQPVHRVLAAAVAAAESAGLTAGAAVSMGLRSTRAV